MTLDYKTIGRAIQIKGDKAVVDKDFLSEQGFDIDKDLSRAEGVQLFNRVASKNDLNELVDPLGYMTLDNNIYDTIHNIYEQKYTSAVDNIESGVMGGGAYGMNAVLDKLNKVIRHDITPYTPENMKYSELRFVETTPSMVESVNEFVTARVRLTYSHGISRSVEQSTFDNILSDMDTAGNKLKEHLDMAYNNVKPKEVLSMKTLLDNGKGDRDSLDAFKGKLKEPSIEWDDSTERAKASFITQDKAEARFLLSNKQYLESFGFDIVKSRGTLNVSWQSEAIDKLYEDSQLPDISEGLNDLSNDANMEL